MKQHDHAAHYRVGEQADDDDNSQSAQIAAHGPQPKGTEHGHCRRE